KQPHYAGDGESYRGPALGDRPPRHSDAETQPYPAPDVILVSPVHRIPRDREACCCKEHPVMCPVQWMARAAQLNAPCPYNRGYLPVAFLLRDRASLFRGHQASAIA